MTPPKKPSYEEENNRLRDWRPVPDPTVLTMEQLLREIASLREIFETRMGGYDKAILLLQEFTSRQPTIAEVVARMDEKFRSVDTQFRERDERTVQSADERRTSVDAMVKLLQNNAKVAEDKINDNRNRLTAIEGSGKAYSQGFSWIGILVGIVAGLATAFAAIFLRGS